MSLKAYAEDCACTHVAEPLLALEAKDSSISVLGCGDCLESEISPKKLVVDRVKVDDQGTYLLERAGEVDIPTGLGEDTPACLPWVRLTRDPKRYRACMSKAQRIGQIKNSKDIYHLLTNQGRYYVSPEEAAKHGVTPLDLRTEDQEVFMIILLDTQARIRGITELTRGARDSVNVPIPDVLRLPLVDGARSFVVAHNHPSGKINPSKADKELTKAIEKAGEIVGIELMDHLVIGGTVDGQDYFSFEDHDLLGK